MFSKKRPLAGTSAEGESSFRSMVLLLLPFLLLLPSSLFPAPLLLPVAPAVGDGDLPSSLLLITALSPSLLNSLSQEATTSAITHLVPAQLNMNEDPNQ
jgi:hypothetical protein